MRSLAANLAAELDNAGHTELFTLVEMQTATPIYLCSDGRSITHDSKTYIPWAFQFGAIGGTIRQTNPTIPLRVLNITHPTTGASRPWSTTLSTESLNGVTVNVRIVMTSELADSTAQIDETRWKTNRPSLDGDWLVLQLGPPQSIGNIETPVPMLRAPRCRWQYKDELCQSVSTLTRCGKTVGECIPRHSRLCVRISQIPYGGGDLSRRTG